MFWLPPWRVVLVADVQTLCLCVAGSGTLRVCSSRFIRRADVCLFTIVFVSWLCGDGRAMCFPLSSDRGPALCIDMCVEFARRKSLSICGCGCYALASILVAVT